MHFSINQFPNCQAKKDDVFKAYLLLLLEVLDKLFVCLMFNDPLNNMSVIKKKWIYEKKVPTTELASNEART